MAASLFDRLCCFGDWENDGGALNPSTLCRALTLLSSGTVNAAYVESNCYGDGESSLTSAQETDLTDLIATMPGTLLTLLGILNRAQWVAKIESILWAGREARSGFTTEALIKTALGV